MADIIGTSRGDNLRGTSGADTIRGLEGNDNIDSRSGNDVIFGDLGNDTLNGRDGNDFLLGGDGSDSMRGGNGNDKLFAGAGNDTLRGEAGNDELRGGAGVDILAGDGGRDLARFDGSDSGVKVVLNGGTARRGEGGHAEGDVLSGIEDLRGSDFNDEFIITNNGIGAFNGGAGNDTLTVEDRINLRDDTLTSIETIRIDDASGGTHGVQLFAGQIIGSGITAFEIGPDDGPGATQIDITMGRTTDLDLSGVATTGFDGNDVFNIRGDNNSEKITGTAARDNIDAAGGNDTLDGGAENDTLNGRDGNDPSPLNAATLSERMACSKEKSDGREALQTRGDHLEAA